MMFPEDSLILRDIFKNNDLIRKHRSLIKDKKVAKAFTSHQLSQWRESIDVVQDYYNDKYSFIDRHKESYEKRLENATYDLYAVQNILARQAGR